MEKPFKSPKASINTDMDYDEGKLRQSRLEVFQSGKQVTKGQYLSH